MEEAVEKKRRLCSRLFKIDLLGKAVPFAQEPRLPNRNRCSPGFGFALAAATFRLVDALLKSKLTAKLAKPNMIFL
jgi:hypothetical protein